MPAWQHNPAMIDLRRWPAGLIENRRFGPLNQRPAACRTPVHFGFQLHLRMAVAADPFHTKKLNGSARPSNKIERPSINGPRAKIVSGVCITLRPIGA